MSRAPKTRSQSHKSSNQGSTLLGVFVGLVIGVLIAAVLAWYFSRPYEFRQQDSNAALPGAVQSGVKAAAEPIALPGKPGDKVVNRPAPVAPASVPVASGSAPAGEKKFDFYDILPKGDQASLPPPSAAKPDAVADRFYLQLGAFSDPSEADNVKARLALIGLEASVQRLETTDKGTLHRVRVGPYLKPEDMNAIRAQLAQAGIESNIVKIRTKPSPAQSAAQ